MGRAEVHFHLLPGVDDGPQCLEESLELARLAVSEGTDTVVTTPHVCDVDVAELEERVAELRSAIVAEHIPIKVIRGGEVAPDDVFGLTQGQLEVVAQGPAGCRWILLESPHDGGAECFSAAAAEVRCRGFAVVVAHPERSAPLEHGRGEAVSRELVAGSYLQVNGMSIVGQYGDTVKAAALELLAGGGPVVVSSDAHSRVRPPCLTGAAFAARASGIAAARVRAAVDDGPRQLLGVGLRPGMTRRDTPVPVAAR